MIIKEFTQKDKIDSGWNIMVLYKKHGADVFQKIFRDIEYENIENVVKMFKENILNESEPVILNKRVYPVYQSSRLGSLVYHNKWFIKIPISKQDLIYHSWKRNGEPKIFYVTENFIQTHCFRKRCYPKLTKKDLFQIDVSPERWFDLI